MAEQQEPIEQTAREGAAADAGELSDEQLGQVGGGAQPTTTTTYKYNADHALGIKETT